MIHLALRKTSSFKLPLLLFIFISFLPLLSVNSQTTYSDGPMRLVVRVAFVYIDDYYDVFGGDQEPRWRVWSRDNPNLDGMDWQGHQCIQYNCACYLWVNAPNNFYNTYWVMDNYYTGSNVPGGIDLRLESFEKDGCSGPNCSYEGSKFSNCYDGDDAHWGPGTVGVNIPYRDMGPPCQWNGSEVVNGTWQYTGWEYYGGSSPYWPYYQWGLQINSYWQYTGDVNGVHTWRGQVDNNWHTACNWSTSHVPDSNDDVIIPPPSGYKNRPVIYSGNAYCHTLEIQGTTGGSHYLEIQSTNGAVLNVTKP